MAKICTRYLRLLDFDKESVSDESCVDTTQTEPPRTSDQEVTYLSALFKSPDIWAFGDRYKLFDYCSMNWATHVSLAGGCIIDDNQLMGSIAAICTKGSQVLFNWLHHHWESLGYGQKELEGFDTLVTASFFGLDTVFHYVLEKGLVGIGQSGPAAMYFAAMAGKANIIRLLLSRGVPATFRGLADWTPLMRAAAAGHSEVVEVLLSTYSDINAVDSRGRSALSLAVGNGHYDVAKLLLECKGIDADQTDCNSTTPLIHAMEGGSPDMLRLLFAHSDAQVNHQDKIGRTALSYAAENGHVEAIKILQELRPKQLDGGLEDIKGHSPVQYAAQKGHMATVRELPSLSSGCGPSIVVASYTVRGVCLTASR